MTRGLSRLSESPVLLARDVEWAVLGGALADARQGLSGVVIVEGPPGMGKTRLLDEAARHAERMGMTVLPTRGSEAAHDVPYATLAAALRRISGDVARPAAVQEVLGLVEREGAATAEAAVFRAVRALLDALVADEPLALVVDDAHHADAGTLRLLSTLVPQLGDDGILVVLGTRPPATTSRAVAAALLGLRGDRVVRIELEPLADPEAAELVRALLGPEASSEAVAAVVACGAGNPLFLGELAHRAATGSAEGLVLGLDVLERVLPTDPGARRLAQAMAAAETITLAQLAAVGRAVDLDQPAAELAFDALAAAGLVHAVDEVGFRVAPDIVCRSVYETLGTAARRRLHRALAEELAAMHAAGAGGDLTDIATHAVRGALGVDPDAASLAAAAGDEHLGRAPAVAAEWYERAVALSPATHAERPERLGRLTVALAQSGATAEALLRGREALASLGSEATRSATVAAMTEALLARGRPRDALELLAAEGGELVGRDPLLAALRGASQVMVEDFPAAERDLTRVRIHASASSEARVVADLYSGYLAHMRGDAATTRAMVRSAVEAAPAAAPLRQLWVYGFGAFLLASSRMPLDAEPLVRRARRLAVTDAAATTMVDLAAVLVDACRSDWDRVLVEGARLAPTLAAREEPERLVVLEALLVMTARAQGKPDITTTTMVGGAAESSADAVAGIVTEARGFLRMREHAAFPPRADGDWQGSPGVEPRWLAGLSAPYASLQAVYGEPVEGPTPTGPFSDLVGLLARAEGKGDIDAAFAAMEAAERLDLPFYIAEAQLALGELGVRPGEMLSTAWRTFDGIGAARYRQRAAAALRDRGLPVPRKRRRVPGSLTQSELQVLELVQQGLRNREIAARLLYSPRTVETYITRIYQKTGITSRIGLVRALAQGDLGVSDDEVS